MPARLSHAIGRASLGAALLVPGLAAAQPASTAPSLDERLGWIAAEFEQAMAEHHAPGAALAVIRDGEVVLMRGFGVADTDTGRPVTPDTRFAVGSTTKAFTATLVGMLADDGLMSYDERVSVHLPAFRLSDPDANERVTIRDLLCHRAGLAVMNAVWYGVPDLTREEVLECVARAEPLHPFRSQWNYSNEGFLAAGMAAGNAAGADWDTLIASRIFEPLGMEHSNTTFDAALADPEMASGYVWRDGRATLERQPMRPADSIGPAGSINSSVRDMSRWVIFQLGRGEIDGRRLISEAAHAETWKPQIEMSPDIDYALGWMIREWEGRLVVEHAGGIDGFTAEVAMLPDEGVGMVMLTNQFASPLQDLSRQIVFRGMSGDISEAAPAPAEDFDRFTGIYTANFGPFDDAKFEVLVQNGRLAVDIPGQMVFELHAPDAEGRRPFTLTDQIAVRFNENDGGEVYSLTIFQGGATPEAFRDGVEPPLEIDLGEAQDYLGVYHLEETDENITALIQNNRLAIDHPGQMVYELHPADDEGWMTLRITDSIRVRFDRDEAGEVVSLTQIQNGVETVLPRTGDSAASLPTIDEIVAAGRDAGWIDSGQGVRSLRITGPVRALNMGLEGTQEVVYAADGRQHSTVDMRRGRLSTSYVSHDAGFSRNFATGDNELSPAMVAALRMQNPLAWAGDWHEQFDDVALAGERQLNGAPVYAVRATIGDERATLLIDRATWMPVAIESRTDTGIGGSLPLTIFLDDWREVGGLLVAHRVTLEVPLGGRIVSEATEAEVNVPINDRMFVAPLEGAG